MDERGEARFAFEAERATSGEARFGEAERGSGDELYPYAAARCRWFLGMPAADSSRTTSYEANGADGRFEASIDVTGELLVWLPFRER